MGAKGPCLFPTFLFVRLVILWLTGRPRLDKQFPVCMQIKQESGMPRLQEVVGYSLQRT